MQGSGIPDLPLNDHIINSALLDIAERLRQMKRSLSDFPEMPTPVDGPQHAQSALMQQELRYDRAAQQQFYDSAVVGLNADQRAVLDAVKTALDAPPQQVWFSPPASCIIQDPQHGD